MAVLDLVVCPICRARDSLARQTTQLESRIHVTYECQQCGTLLAWLGDEMWLEADRWSFQKVGLPERADLLYRSMTVAELRQLAGEKAPYTAPPASDTSQAIPPPVWIDMAPAEDQPVEDLLPEAFEEQAPPVEERESQPDKVAGAAVVGAAILAQSAVEEQPAAAQPAGEDDASLEASAGAAMVGAAPVAGQQGAGQEPLAEVATEPAQAGDAPGEESPSDRAARPRRRSRGSPFLVISVGLVLLCLICSAAAMVIYSMWDWLPAGTMPTASLPAGEVQPEETALPTDTPFPTATPTPEPTEAPPEAAGGVEFQGVTDYLASTGSHYLVGEVLNRTADTLRFVEVLATFYGADGQEVGTASTFTELGIIEPGSTAPFKMATLNPPRDGHYDLRADYSTTTQSPIRLELMGHSGSTADSGWYHIVGEVRNPHGFAVKFPEIVATYYNASHQVVRVEVDFAQVDPLEPGQSSPFEVVLTDPPADLTHYTLQTEAVQQ
jgi:hypothetical protein